MSYRRDHHTSKSPLFDGFDKLEEGGLRSSSSFSYEIKEHDNGKVIDSLQDSHFSEKSDIHDEVDSHNRLLDRMGNDMEATRGIMSGTMDRFKKDA
ncbi:hypothetical protein CRYUN_Cryun36dG0070600 [Craigia yunnanensis]